MTLARERRDYRATPRRHPAHLPPTEAHNRPVILLVTACIWHREPLLACLESQDALLRAWKEADDWSVGSYVVMPDHVHLFCTPGKLDRRGIKEWAAFWKRRVGEHRTALEGKFQWDCWDTQMRSMGHYCRKLEYVRQNPVRAGLVPRSEDWPYQGRMKDIWW